MSRTWLACSIATKVHADLILMHTLQPAMAVAGQKGLLVTSVKQAAQQLHRQPANLLRHVNQHAEELMDREDIHLMSKSKLSEARHCHSRACVCAYIPNWT